MSFRASRIAFAARATGLAGRILLLLSMCLVAQDARSAEWISFQAGNGGWHMGSLAVGNISGDSTPEIVVPYRNLSGQWFLDAYRPDGTRLPGFPYSGGTQEINTSPTLYDLDADGLEEIIFTCGHNVVALRGDGEVFWSASVDHSNYLPDSGFMAITNGFYWSDGGGFISRLPSTAVFSSQVSSPVIADVDGNGSKEIVTAWKIDPDSTSSHQDFNPFINDVWGSGEWGTMGEVWSGGVVFFDAATGQRSYTYHFHQLVESGIALGQADADAPLEVYVLNDSDSVAAFDKTKPHGFHGDDNLHKQFGKNQRLLSGSYQLGADIYATDIDGDGVDEILVASTQSNPLWQPNETILDDDGAILWRQWKQPVTIPVNQWQNSASLIPVNPDRDNRIDVLGFTHSHQITYRCWNGVELVSHPGWPKDFYPLLPTTPVMGDVDGDGAEEIIIGTYDPAQPSADGDLYVFALDGSLKTSVVVPGGLKHIPTLADVNGDGGVEVVYRSQAGRIYIQNFGASQAGPVSWGSHRGNRHRDGNLGRALFPSGTPVITGKAGGYRRATFSWAPMEGVKAWRIYRAESPAGPFHPLVTLTAGVTSCTDHALEPGSQYLYEVGAVWADHTIRSAPFAILSELEENLIHNGGFEENDNSHWDKWFTGEIPWSSMEKTGEDAHLGRWAMQVTLTNQGSNGTVSQFGQYGTPDAHMLVTSGELYSFGGFLKSRGLSQSSEHWFEWSSTVTAADPMPRPARPWPFYFTPYFTLDTNSTDWTYANRTFVMPEGFPNAGLIHRYTTSAPASGSFLLDDIFFRRIPSPASTNWTTLIPFGAGWRYSIETPVSGWHTESFNDNSWPHGFAKLGSGSGPTNILTPLTPQQPAYYFRHTFTVPSQPWKELLLSATCTSGGGKYLEVYLNGIRLNTTGIDVTSNQGNDLRYYDLAPFIPHLHPGQNTIAVVLNNVWNPSWDDVAFDLRLQAMSYTPVTAGFHSILPDGGLLSGAGGIDLEVSAPLHSIWRIESADGLTSPQWQLMERMTNNLAVPFWLRDVGQGGRVPPQQVPHRFYRLVPE